MAAKMRGMMEEDNKEYAISGKEEDWKKALSVSDLNDLDDLNDLNDFE